MLAVEVAAMAEGGERERDLQHELANAEQAKRALQFLLTKAADQIVELIEAGGDEHVTVRAEKMIATLRQAASR